MLHLIFDTETTGMKDNKRTCTDSCQPKLVQFAARLYDDVLDKVVSTVDLTIRPEHGGVKWDIPVSASNIHGIPTDTAHHRGVPLHVAVDLAYELFGVADIVVAHNLDFDKTVMRRAMRMTTDIYEEHYVDPFEGVKTFCTMKTTTNILKIKKARGGFKWPKLNDCMQHFYAEDILNAHNALADVDATLRVYKAIKFPEYAKKDGLECHY